MHPNSEGCQFRSTCFSVIAQSSARGAASFRSEFYQQTQGQMLQACITQYAGLWSVIMHGLWLKFTLLMNSAGVISLHFGPCLKEKSTFWSSSAVLYHHTMIFTSLIWVVWWFFKNLRIHSPLPISLAQTGQTMLLKRLWGLVAPSQRFSYLATCQWFICLLFRTGYQSQSNKNCLPWYISQNVSAFQVYFLVML